MTKRCTWCGSDPLYIEYHDNEWGIPVRDDQLLFEFLVLEGAQAGLNWLTILRKRENYRFAFSHFDYTKVANYDDSDIERLLGDAGIVRNKLKIQSTIKNARGVIEIQKEFGSLSDYLWGFVNNSPIINHWSSVQDIPAKTAISEQMSKALKKRGFNFVGPTICYAFMQAVGMVNDHTTDCFCYTR